MNPNSLTDARIAAATKGLLHLSGRGRNDLEKKIEEIDALFLDDALLARMQEEGHLTSAWCEMDAIFFNILHNKGNYVPERQPSKIQEQFILLRAKLTELQRQAEMFTVAKPADKDYPEYLEEVTELTRTVLQVLNVFGVRAEGEGGNYILHSPQEDKPK